MTARSPARDVWLDAIRLVLLTRVTFWLVAWLGGGLLGGGTGPPRTGVGHWRRWDADIYATIAEHGYAGPGAEPWSEAFPPLWPLLLRAAGALGLSPTVAGLVLTTVASVVAVAFLIRLVDEETSPAAGSSGVGVPSPGRRAAWYLLLFPTAVFLVAGYAEALFLAGAIPAFRAARRGRWPAVALPAAVAVGARWVGLLLLLGLAVELLTRRPDRRRLLTGAAALAAATLPALGYAAWTWITRGDPLYVLTAQREGWGRTFVGPVEALRATWNTWGSDQPTAFLLAWRLEILAAALGFVLLWVLLRRREWGYATFVAATLTVMTTSSWYYSIPRILLTLFPLVVHLARWTSAGRGRHEAVLAVSTSLATLGVIVFTRGGWFF